MAETAQLFSNGGRNTVEALFCLYGRVYFVNRWYEAQQVFRSSALHARLGDVGGLRRLGMDGQGIIWNNDDAKWRVQRKIFTEAVQDRREVKRRWVAQLCHEATQLTLHEAREAAGAAAAVGGDVVRLNGLNLLRCITCRVTLGLAFGLAPGSMSYDETLLLVRKVNAFFKAWEFFLLRPGWFLWTVRRKAAIHHLASVDALRAAVEDVLRRATGGGGGSGGGAWPPAAPGSDSAVAAAAAAAAAASAGHPPFLKSTLEHVADGRRRIPPCEMR
ncbi:hypothetical protein PLESTM_000220700 [Pleodorina starrii]|nr:hypothetical protein PLESTM_000220700 [Pleodorina starrii]